MRPLMSHGLLARHGARSLSDADGDWHLQAVTAAPAAAALVPAAVALQAAAPVAAAAAALAEQAAAAVAAVAVAASASKRCECRSGFTSHRMRPHHLHRSPIESTSS